MPIQNPLSDVERYVKRLAPEEVAEYRAAFEKFHPGTPFMAIDPAKFREEQVRRKAAEMNVAELSADVTRLRGRIEFILDDASEGVEGWNPDCLREFCEVTLGKVRTPVDPLKPTYAELVQRLDLADAALADSEKVRDDLDSRCAAMREELEARPLAARPERDDGGDVVRANLAELAERLAAAEAEWGIVTRALSRANERVGLLQRLLARVVKYAHEDRARTPGKTRLARVLREAEGALADAPQPASVQAAPEECSDCGGSDEGRPADEPWVGCGVSRGDEAPPEERAPEERNPATGQMRSWAKEKPATQLDALQQPGARERVGAKLGLPVEDEKCIHGWVGGCGDCENAIGDYPEPAVSLGLDLTDPEKPTLLDSLASDLRHLRDVMRLEKNESRISREWGDDLNSVLWSHGIEVGESSAAVALRIETEDEIRAEERRRIANLIGMEIRPGARIMLWRFPQYVSDLKSRLTQIAKIAGEKVE